MKLLFLYHRNCFCLIILFILLFFIKANSQAPEWQWAQSAKSPFLGQVWASDIVHNDSGNIYVTGGFNRTTIFDNFVLTDTTGVFLAKYDSSGNVKWVTRGRGPQSGSNRVAMDKSNNIYLTGYYNDTITFDSYVLTNAGPNDIFFVKYNPSGNVLWAKSIGGSKGETVFGVAADAWGNVYIAGGFQSDSLAFDSIILINSAYTNVFLAKYDSSGKVLWARSSGGTGNGVGASVATDNSSNVYLTGIFTSSSITFDTFTLPNVGGNDIFLVKYDSSGNVQWAKSAGGVGNESSYRIATDSFQQVYMTGNFQSSYIAFGVDTLVNSGMGDFFLARYDSSGNIKWVRNAVGTGNDGGLGLSTDNSGRVYVSGITNSTKIIFDTITLQYQPSSSAPLFIAEYDSSGKALFATGLPSGGYYDAITVTTSGSIYVCGSFNIDTLIVGNDSLKLVGYLNAFVAKLNFQEPNNIAELIKNYAFSLFPNPNNGIINIKMNNDNNSEKSIIVIDMLGKTIWNEQKSFKDEIYMDISSQPAGVYFVKVFQEGKMAVEKIVKM